MANEQAKHTPGPWMPALTSLSKSLRIYTCVSGESTRAGNEIASVPVLSGQPGGTPFDMLPTTVQANANLIAAAPDLLRELRLLNVDENGEQKRNTPAWRVIAKAEGRS